MNSLGFPGCDLDIYLDLGPEAVEGSEYQNGLRISNPKMEGVVESTVKGEHREEGGEKAKIREREYELKQEIKKERVILDEAAELVEVQDPISQQQKVRTAAKILRGVPECSRVHPILQVIPFSRSFPCPLFPSFHDAGSSAHSEVHTS